MDVELARRSPSRLGITEYLRLAVGTVGRGKGKKHVASPLGRGAGNISTLSRAQAVARIPAHVEGIEQGDNVPAELLVSHRALERILVAVGSHDNTLDALADALMGLDEPVRLASSHVGSMGGLMAVKSGSCHLAGAHLFDPESGDYNFPFLAKHLPGVEVRVVNLAIRHQGLMVAPGNPLAIQGVEDLASGRVRFVNRQRGAGTRILLDHHLKRASFSPDQVDGYGKEEFTHMAVAVNVLTGAADCGLGIRAAAKALGLDFVPLARERYDLVIPAGAMDDPKVAAMLTLLRDPAFQARIRAMEGYETELTGRVMSPGMGLG